ncbi:MAG: alanine racemase [Candidatus Omnitrophica bacterium]|nr:alanine racemase [Candidatus Omnitrophota bacterium]
MRPTWAEIDLRAIEYNFRQIRRFVGGRIKILACVKADAYGHGAVRVSRVLGESGADCLGVALVKEAAELRSAGIRLPIHILGCLLPEEIPGALKADVVFTVADMNFCKILSSEAAKRKKVVKVHIKVDTGMGRIGIMPEQAKSFTRELLALRGIEPDGIFTHFPSADEKKSDAFTRRQINTFAKLTDSLNMNNLIRHTANSAAILNFPEAYFDMVRPGLILYGIYPGFVKRRCLKVKPAFNLKTRIAFLKEVPAGASVSYGRTFRATRRSIIATLPLGYDDGFNRGLSNKAEVIVRGKRAPQAGIICMDQAMIDVTGIKGVKTGDEVVVYGRWGKECISIEEIANRLHTTPHEVVCTVSERVPRVYRGEV